MLWKDFLIAVVNLVVLSYSLSFNSSSAVISVVWIFRPPKLAHDWWYFLMGEHAWYSSYMQFTVLPSVHSVFHFLFFGNSVQYKLRDVKLLSDWLIDWLMIDWRVITLLWPYLCHIQLILWFEQAYWSMPANLLPSPFFLYCCVIQVRS